MKKKFVCVFIALGLLISVASTTADAESPPTGLWYGIMSVTEGAYAGYSNVFSIDFEYLSSGLVSVFITELSLFDQYIPAIIDGNTITIGDPLYGAVLTGELDGNSIDGSFGTYLGNGTWIAEKYIPFEAVPGDAPGLSCDDLPPLYCIGGSDYCSELVQFDPSIGEGYIDYPMNGEAWDDQFRSYIRRDLMMLIDYATAKVACKADDWEYGNYAPLGLIDMSEEDGSIPGTSIGYPGHPPGTHEDGKDIDTAYYQLYTDDNMGRVVGLHYDFHLVEPPYNFDKWRTALFISYLAEHPVLRVVGVDGQIGLILEGTDDQYGTFDDLVDKGWIDPAHRDFIPLAYEVEDTGLGWFRFHHHHMHVSMNPIYNIVSSMELSPDTLSERSNGKYVTAYLEFNEDIDVYQINMNGVALILNGHTMLWAQPEDIKFTDYNENGIDDLTIKFDRQSVLESIGNGDVEISIAGLVGSQIFQESDMVRVIGHPNKVIQRNSKPEIPFARPGGRAFWPE